MSNYIICTAPIHIHRVLAFINNNAGDYTIVCPGELKPFFKKFTDCYVLVPWLHPNLITRNNLKQLPLNLVRLFRNYHHYFSKIRGQDINVFFTSWALSYMYFIRKLNKRNVIHLWLPQDNYGRVPDYFPEQKDLVSACMRWFARILLGLKTTVMDKSVPAYEMDRTGYQQHMFDPNKMLVYRKLMTDTELVKDMDVLFLSENVTTEGADLESVESISDEVYTMLNYKFGERWCIKGHPREPDMYGYMATLPKKELSRFIIAEVLYGHRWKVIMSYYSEALISASKLTDAKVISLMNLFDWGNKKLFKYWKDRFRDYGVLCPKSIKELNELLEQ